MIKVGLIHTTMNSIAPSNAGFRRVDAAVETVNFLDESLMPPLRTAGMTQEVRRGILHMAYQAETAGCSGIMLTCSLLSPYAEQIAACVSVPLIAADHAMLEYAVDRSNHAGIIATVEKTGTAIEHLLKELAAEKSRPMHIITKIAHGAFEALERGDEALHNRLVQESARTLDGTVDLIVFAQISMARALTEDFHTAAEIVTSPETAARALLARINGV